MQNRFSLIDEPWIKTVDTDNSVKTIGLRELFQRATEFVDIAGSPTEIFSTWRLLLCIAHRAYGSVTEDNWEEIPETLQEQCLSYLDSQYSNFFLLGDRPFLQIPDLECKKINTTDVLDPMLSTGNNPVFYDHNGGTPREHDFAWIARKLLTIQNFALCGILQGSNKNALSDVTVTKNKIYPKNFPRTNSLLTMLKGKSLFETLHWNMIPDELSGRTATDKPVWEIDIENKSERENLKKSFLGQLVPLARFVRILNERDCYFSGQLIYPSLYDGLLDIFETYCKSNKGFFKLSFQFERQAWRDLCSILSLRDAEKGGGALCMNNLKRIYDADDLSTFRVYCGGFLARSDIQKPIFEGAWEYSLDFDSIDESVRSVYEQGIEAADLTSGDLKKAVKKYRETLGQKDYNTAREEEQFWNELNQDYPLLQRCAKAKDLTDWKARLSEIRDEIYERSCQRVTARQMKAFVIGRREFLKKCKKSKI